MARMFERGCSDRGWQGKILKGALKGGDFLQGCFNVGVFSMGCGRGRILVSNSNGL